MKTKILMLMLCATTLMALAQDPVQRPGYGYRNEVDTSKHLINGFGINTLDFNGTANAVITVDSSDVVTPKALSDSSAAIRDDFPVIVVDSAYVADSAAAIRGDILLVIGDTATAVLGKIVFIEADSSFYGCRSTVADKKWFKLTVE